MPFAAARAAEHAGTHWGGPMFRGAAAHRDADPRWVTAEPRSTALGCNRREVPKCRAGRHGARQRWSAGRAPMGARQGVLPGALGASRRRHSPAPSRMRHPASVRGFAPDVCVPCVGNLASRRTTRKAAPRARHMPVTHIPAPGGRPTPVLTPAMRGTHARGGDSPALCGTSTAMAPRPADRSPTDRPRPRRRSHPRTVRIDR